MKEILLTLVACLSIFISMANPIYRPDVSLYKFSLDENQNWKLILRASHLIDSLKISNSTERSSFSNVSNIFNTEYNLSRDSLHPFLNINPEGDSVTIISYLSFKNSPSDSIVETFIFGNYPNATLPIPSKDQYIGRICESIMGTNYHTVFNSTGKFTGTLYGKIYNKNSQLLTNGSFKIDPIPIALFCLEGGYNILGFDLNSDGTYSASLHSSIYNQNNIVSCSRDERTNCILYSERDTLSIENIKFSILPDSTVELDIHLLDDYVGIGNIQINSPDILKIFPNPASSNEIQYEMSVPVRSTNCFIQLYNATGQIIWHQNITDNRGSLTLPTYISNGTIILQLWMNGKAYQSKKLIISR
jgi:hypothetical protein